MDGRDLHRLFMAAIDGPGETTEAVRRVLSTLIRVTLDYRDHLLESKGRTLTVRDVQISLSWLVPCLATGNLPEIDDPVCLDLLEKWLEALKHTPHKVHPYPSDRKNPEEC